MRLQVLKTITKCLQSKHGLDSTGRAELSVFIAISFHFILLALSIFGFFMAARICVGKLLMKKKRTSIVRVNASSSS